MEPEDHEVMIPVRDVTEKDRPNRTIFHDKDASLVQERAGINKLSREELEDRHLRLLEQNQVLKKHCHKQEDKIKRLATKLLRLVQDRKRSGEAGRRDPETAELVQSQQEEISSLQQQLAQTKDKLLVARQQVASGAARLGRSATKPEPARRPSSRPSSKTSSLRPPVGAASDAPPPLPAYAERLLVEAREVAARLQRQTAALTSRNAELEDTVSAIRQQCTVCEQELEMQKEQLRAKEMEHEEEVEAFRNQLNHASRCKLSENVEMIKLQRELKQTASQLSGVQAHCQQLEDERRKLQPSLERASRELADLRRLHEAEQRRCQQLQRDLVTSAQTHQQLEEARAALASTQKENDLLRAANERLSEIGGTEQNWQHQAEALQSQLRSQVASLETTLRSEQTRCRQLTDQLTAEQQRSWRLQAETLQLQERLMSRPAVAVTSEPRPPLPQAYVQVPMPQAKPEIRHQAVNTTLHMEPDYQGEETTGKHESPPEPPDTPTTELLNKIDSGVPVRRQLASLHCQYVETVRELEKTRTLLDVQKQINAAQQQEVALLSRRLTELTKTRDKQEGELRATLEARNGRVVALEKKLRQLVYRGPGDSGSTAAAAPLDSSLQLEAGCCLLELHVHSLTLKQQVWDKLAGEGVFLTWVFYNQDTHYTPVLRGGGGGSGRGSGGGSGTSSGRLDFDCSSLYKLAADQRLLQYLKHDQLTVEAHRTEGENGSRHLGTVTISCREMLDYPRNKLHGTAEMVEVGTLSYWFRGDATLEALLHRPAPQPPTPPPTVGADAHTPHAVSESTAAGGTGDQTIVAGSPDMCDTGPGQPKVGHGPAAVSTPVRRKLASRRAAAASASAAASTAAFASLAAESDDTGSDHTAERRASSWRHRLAAARSETDVVSRAEAAPQPRPAPRRASQQRFRAAAARQDETPRTAAAARQDETPRSARAAAAARQDETPRSARAGRARRPARRIVNQSAPPVATAPAPAQTQRPAVPAGPVTHTVAVPRRVVSAPKAPLAEVAERDGATAEATVAPAEQQRRPPLPDQLPATTAAGYATYTETSGSSASSDGEESPRQMQQTQQPRHPSQESDSQSNSERAEAAVINSKRASAAATAWGTGTTNGGGQPGTADGDSRRASPSDSGSGSGDGVRVAVEVHRRLSAGPATSGSSSGGSPSSGSGTDSEGVVLHRRPVLQDPPASEAITVTIHTVMLEATASVYTAASTGLPPPCLFVEFRLLDVPPEELEAPHSLPLPPPGQPLSFNFRKVVNAGARRRQLAAALRPDALDAGQLAFYVVAEPPDADAEADADDESAECTDVGWARLSLQELLSSGSDLQETRLPLTSAAEPAGAEVGSLVVSVRALEALRAAAQHR